MSRAPFHRAATRTPVYSLNDRRQIIQAAGRIKHTATLPQEDWSKLTATIGAIGGHPSITAETALDLTNWVVATAFHMWED